MENKEKTAGEVFEVPPEFNLSEVVVASYEQMQERATQNAMNLDQKLGYKCEVVESANRHRAKIRARLKRTQ